MTSRDFRRWIKGDGPAQHVVVFAVCVLWDGMLSLDTVFTSQFSIGPVGATSWANVMMSYLLFDAVVDNSIISWSKAHAAALGAAMGGMIGTALTRMLYV